MTDEASGADGTLIKDDRDADDQPDRFELTDTQRRDLDRLVRAGRTEQRLPLRAGIVLGRGGRTTNVRIAASLGVCEDTARKWRHRWCAAPGVSSLSDAHRSGRRSVFSPVQVAQVKAVACTPPTQAGQPLPRWSCPELARSAVTARICRSISPATVRGWLALLGITGMYLSQIRRNRVLGLVGYSVLAAGYLLILCGVFAAAYVMPEIAEANAGYVNDVTAADTGRGTVEGDIGALQTVIQLRGFAYLAGGLSSASRSTGHTSSRAGRPLSWQSAVSSASFSP